MIILKKIAVNTGAGMMNYTNHDVADNQDRRIAGLVSARLRNFARKWLRRSNPSLSPERRSAVQVQMTSIMKCLRAEEVIPIDDLELEQRR